MSDADPDRALSPSVSRDYLLSLPTALLAIVLGRVINRQAIVTWTAHQPAAR